MARAFATTAYRPKLRLLVTDSCPHTCPFCHNEGQAVGSAEIDLEKLEQHLPALRQLSRHVTITGGEPLSAKCFPSLVRLLGAHDFAITIDTAGAFLHRYESEFRLVEGLHVSLISLDVRDELSRCNGPVAAKLERLREIRRRDPLLKMTINVPWVAEGEQLGQLSTFVEIASELGASLKLVGEYSSAVLWIGGPPSWGTRWGAVVEELVRLGYVPDQADEREADFVHQSRSAVSLADIACAAVGAEFRHGECFRNMDVTIQTDLSVTLCRWQSHSVSLERFVGATSGELASLVQDDVSGCPYGLSVDDASLKLLGTAGIHTEHGRWPLLTDNGVARIRVRADRMLLTGELSYFGREGVVRELEETARSLFEADYCLSFASGSAALFAAYHALGWTDGAKVLVPDHSYPGTVVPLMFLGAEVIVCGVDPERGTLDMAEVAAVAGEIDGVVVTHMWGRPADMTTLQNLRSQYGFGVVEDSSHAVGGYLAGRPLGSFGDIACISMQANKSLFAGEGGIAVTSNSDLFEEMVLLSSLGPRILDSVRDPRRRQLWRSGTGMKLKLHPLGAVVALESLRSIVSTNARRGELIEQLRSGLDSAFVRITPLLEDESDAVYYRPKLLLQREFSMLREIVVDRAIRMGLQVATPDSVPVRELAVRRGPENGISSIGDATRWTGGHPATDFLGRAISLPNFTQESPDLIRYYARCLSRIALEACEGSGS